MNPSSALLVGVHIDDRQLDFEPNEFDKSPSVPDDDLVQKQERLQRIERPS
jgi:hypothetical protein